MIVRLLCRSSGRGRLWSPSVRLRWRSRIVGRVHRDERVRDPPTRACRSTVLRLRPQPLPQRRHPTRWAASGQGAIEPFAPSVADWAIAPEKLRYADDRVRNLGSLNQVFLGHLRLEVTARQKAISADDRQRKVMTHPRSRFRGPGGCVPPSRRTPSPPCPRTKASSPHRRRPERL